MKIWIDADACPRPVKQVIFRAAAKRGVEAVLVANHALATPKTPRVSAIVVREGADVADDWIAERVAPDDLVVTADIPLAARVVERGATGVNPRGETYTESNVRERLSVRDFMADLREMGVDTGGPAPWSKKDTERFANALDRFLTSRGA